MSFADVSANKFSKDTIQITAYDPRYACGDWVDDLTVVSVSDANYTELVGQDIDPYLEQGSGRTSDIVSDFIWASFNGSDASADPGRVILEGIPYAEQCSGCDGDALPFKILSMKMESDGRSIVF